MFTNHSIWFRVAVAGMNEKFSGQPDFRKFLQIHVVFLFLIMCQNILRNFRTSLFTTIRKKLPCV